MVHLDVGHNVLTCSHHGRIGMEAESNMEIVQLHAITEFQHNFRRLASLISIWNIGFDDAKTAFS